MLAGYTNKMGLIKSNDALQTIAPFSMRDIETQARSMLLRAAKQAEKILADAQVEGTKLRQKAYDEGFIAGREDGLRRGDEEGRAAGNKTALAEQRANLERLINSLSATITTFDASRADFQSQAMTDVVRLAVAIARRVTKIQGSLDANITSENVRAAVRLIGTTSDVRIAVNPQQKQTLEATLPQLKLTWPNLKYIELIDDATIEPGGCRLFTAQGEIDADLNSQIDRIAADLLPTSVGAT